MIGDFVVQNTEKQGVLSFCSFKKIYRKCHVTIKQKFNFTKQKKKQSFIFIYPCCKLNSTQIPCKQSCQANRLLKQSQLKLRAL